MAELPLVSIIIPVYNVERYLRKCLGSILAQTYTNLEILAVDDASLDGSATILKEYAAKDNRVQIFTHKINRGLSAARNTGLEVARGQYVQFVDSDDYLDPKICERLVTIAERTQADQVKCGFRLVDTEDKEIRRRTPKAEFFDLTQVAERRIAFEHHRKFFLVWNGIFRRAAIGDLRMDVQALSGEDILFCGQMFTYSRRLAMVSDVLYHYVQHSQSTMHTPTLAKSLKGIYAIQTLFQELYALPESRAIYDSLWTLLWNQGRGVVIHYMANSANTAHSTAEVDSTVSNRILWNAWKDSMSFTFSESEIVPKWWRWFYRYALDHNCPRLFFSKIFAPGNIRQIRARFLHPGDFFVILRARRNFAKIMSTEGERDE